MEMFGMSEVLFKLQTTEQQQIGFNWIEWNFDLTRQKFESWFPLRMTLRVEEVKVKVKVNLEDIRTASVLTGDGRNLIVGPTATEQTWGLIASLP
jgi:hypothetical protein